MAAHKALPFLRGTFSWSSLGFFHATSPPVNLLAPESLASDNPWLIVAAVMEHAKKGNHDLVSNLQQWFRNGHEGYLDRISLMLTGDAGRKTDVQVLPTIMQQGPDDLRAYACGGAAQAGYLWLVPHMLDAWIRVTSLADHQTIGYAIARLLEPDGGPIAEHAGTFPFKPEAIAETKNPELRELLEEIAESEESPPEFEVLVRAKLAELREKLGADQAVVWEGELFSVRRLAEKMYGLAREPSPVVLTGTFISLRHKFEAATGINCTEFFQNGVFQPLAAAAILEDFLEGSEAAKYEDGVRYFFGHRIPD